MSVSEITVYPPELIDECNAEYHSDLSRISHSMLEVFRESPLTYQARFVTETMAKPEPTPAMCLGTALHAMVLEPDRFDELVIVAPDVDRRTKDGKRAWEEFCKTIDGRAVITPEQHDVSVKMAKSILAHPEASMLLKRAEYREKSIRWTNEQSGLRCKCRPDLFWKAGCVIADIKTSCDPSPGPWARQAASLGYHRQNAYYRVGVGTVIGKQPRFMHVVVGTCEPYECCCYYMEEDVIAHGEFQNQQAMNQVAQCYQTDDWAAPQNRGIQIISLPRWATFE